MKRNIIEMGGKTYVVSLPAPWIKKYGVKKGEEVEVTEEGEKVVVSCGKTKTAEKAKIDVTDAVPAYIWWSINAAYIRGSDEIEITYSPKEEKTVNEVAKTLIGFAIVSQRKNAVVIKDVSGNATEFDSILRRVFFILEGLGNEGAEAIQRADKEQLASFREKDYEINYSVNFCLRYLNKKGYAGYTETSLVYSTLLMLESLGDEYADFLESISKSKLKMSKENIKLFQRVNNMFGLYSKLFFNYEKALAIEVINARYSLLKEIDNMMRKSQKDESIALANLKSMVGIIFNLAELKHVAVR